MLLPRFDFQGLALETFASVEGDDPPTSGPGSKAGLVSLQQDIQTALILGPIIVSAAADDAMNVFEIIPRDGIQNVVFQLTDDVRAEGSVERIRGSVTSILDRGALAVVLALDGTGTADFKAIVSGIPADRVGAALTVPDLNSNDTVETMKGLNSAVGWYIVTVLGEVSVVDSGLDEPSPKASFVRDLATSAIRQLGVLAQSGRPRRLAMSLPKTRISTSVVVKLEKMDVALIAESTGIEFRNVKGGVADAGAAGGAKAVNLTDAFVACLVTDRSDGLFATVVVDEQGVALGLAYSSHESIREAIRTRQGVYHSRSRGLWYKGLTSGATQVLLRVEVDCDKDALRFTVHQNDPGYCHLNTRTCFGPDKGLTALAAVLQSRKASAPSGSYTRRLFEDDALLNSKIMEEAEELCEAKDQDEVAWEAADLIYFALTKCVKAGVGLTDIERHLDLRARKISRRPGNAKPKWSAAQNADAN